MMKRIAGFKGEMPKSHPRLLPDEYAQVAINTRLENGALVPLRQAALEETLLADAQTIYLHGSTWRSWNAVVDVVQAPVAADRLYVTGDGEPKLFVDPTTYPLALPAPASALTLVVNGALDADLKEGILYTYTYVTEFDEESQPAPLSAEAEFSPGQDVDLSGFVAAPLGRAVNRIRVYRSQTSVLGVTDLYFVKELPVATFTYNHDEAVDPLQESMTSEYYTPPVAGLSGIIALPNGVMAAFAGKELFFSEPYIPHAWPARYALKTDYNIVGLAAFGSNVAVLTEGSPYVVQGTHPESMLMELLEVNLPCVSARGIVDLGYSIAYPSTEGIVTIGQGGAQLVTQGLFTREQWDAVNAETFICSQHRGRYIASHTPEGASTREVMIVDLTGEQPFLMHSGHAPDATFFEIGSGRMFMLIGLREIYEWDRLDQELEQQTWRSKLYNMPTPTNFGAILIEGDELDGAPELTADVYADGIKVATSTKWNEPDRLPSGFLAVRWEVEVKGTIGVTSISFANDIEEFAGGG